MVSLINVYNLSINKGSKNFAPVFKQVAQIEEREIQHSSRLYGKEEHHEKFYALYVLQ